MGPLLVVLAGAVAAALLGAGFTYVQDQVKRRSEQRQAAAAFRFELQSNLGWLNDIVESMIYLRDEAWVKMKNEGYVSYLRHPIPLQIIDVYDRLQRLNRKLKDLREGDSADTFSLMKAVESHRDELRQEITKLIASFDDAYPQIARNFKDQ